MPRGGSSPGRGHHSCATRRRGGTCPCGRSPRGASGATTARTPAPGTSPSPPAPCRPSSWPPRPSPPRRYRGGGGVLLLRHPRRAAPVRRPHRRRRPGRAGMVPEALESTLDRLQREGRTVAFVYTIATHQNPSGTILPPERRAARAGHLQPAGHPRGGGRLLRGRRLRGGDAPRDLHPGRAGRGALHRLLLQDPRPRRAPGLLHRPRLRRPEAAGLQARRRHQRPRPA